MPGCAMFGCKSYSCSTKGTDIRYFSFSNAKELRDKWVIACRREDKFNIKNGYVRSMYFDKKCLETSFKHQLLNYLPKNIRNLKPHATPNSALAAAQQEEKIVDMRNKRNKR